VVARQSRSKPEKIPSLRSEQSPQSLAMIALQIASLPLAMTFCIVYLFLKQSTNLTS